MRLGKITTANAKGLAGGWVLLDNFSDNDYTANPSWTQVVKSNSGQTISAATGALVLASTTTGKIAYSTPLTQATGSWSADIRRTGPSGQPADGEWHFLCVNNVDSGTGTSIIIKGYKLLFADFTSQVLVYRDDGSSSNAALLGGLPWDSSMHNWRVTRDAAGLMHIYRDNILVGSVTDNTYTTCTQMAVGYVGTPSGGNVTFDNIYYSPFTNAGPAPL